MGMSDTMGFILYHVIYGSVWGLPMVGYSVHGYRCSVGKSDLQVTHFKHIDRLVVEEASEQAVEVVARKRVAVKAVEEVAEWLRIRQIQVSSESLQNLFLEVDWFVVGVEFGLISEDARTT